VLYVWQTQLQERQIGQKLSQGWQSVQGTVSHVISVLASLSSLAGHICFISFRTRWSRHISVPDKGQWKMASRLACADGSGASWCLLQLQDPSLNQKVKETAVSGEAHWHMTKRTFF
jgi:hypothetical protein